MKELMSFDINNTTFNEITFCENENGIFCIELFLFNQEKLNKVEGDLIAYRRMHDADEEFDISSDKIKISILLVGNIDSALELLKDRNLIDKNQYENMINTSIVKLSLQKSKGYRIASNEFNEADLYDNKKSAKEEIIEKHLEESVKFVKDKLSDLEKNHSFTEEDRRSYIEGLSKKLNKLSTKSVSLSLSTY